MESGVNAASFLDMGFTRWPSTGPPPLPSDDSSIALTREGSLTDLNAKGTVESKLPASLRKSIALSGYQRSNDSVPPLPDTRETSVTTPHDILSSEVRCRIATSTPPPPPSQLTLTPKLRGESDISRKSSSSYPPPPPPVMDPLSLAPTTNQAPGAAVGDKNEAVGDKNEGLQNSFEKRYDRLRAFSSMNKSSLSRNLSQRSSPKTQNRSADFTLNRPCSRSPKLPRKSGLSSQVERLLQLYGDGEESESPGSGSAGSPWSTPKLRRSKKFVKLLDHLPDDSGGIKKENLKSKELMKTFGASTNPHGPPGGGIVPGNASPQGINRKSKKLAKVLGEPGGGAINKSSKLQKMFGDDKEVVPSSRAFVREEARGGKDKFAPKAQKIFGVQDRSSIIVSEANKSTQKKGRFKMFKDVRARKERTESTSSVDFDMRHNWSRYSIDSKTGSLRIRGPRTGNSFRSKSLAKGVEPVRKTGRLGKKKKQNVNGDPVAATYQDRVFFLQNNILYYFKPASKVMAGIIMVEDITRIKMKEQKKNKIEIYIGKSMISLRTKSTAERDEWIKAIRNNMKMKSEMRLPDPQRQSIFASGKSRIGLHDLRVSATTLDILLFKSKQGLAPALVRGLTNSHYDHVALLVKTESGQLCVFEAVRLGVILTTIEGFVEEKWIESHAEVALRQVHLPTGASGEMLERLSTFIDATCGKPYEWSLTKMMRSNSVLNFDDLKRTFFCSELVAAVYKEMGLLRPDIPSAAYTPGDFAGDLTLLQGATFGPLERLNLVKASEPGARRKSTKSSIN